jgi:replicative DNA helicase
MVHILLVVYIVVSLLLVIRKVVVSLTTYARKNITCNYSHFGKYLTDKQNVDKNISELKRIAREHDISVIAVSSFNRSNYIVEAGYESFKEIRKYYSYLNLIDGLMDSNCITADAVDL